MLCNAVITFLEQESDQKLAHWINKSSVTISKEINKGFNPDSRKCSVFSNTPSTVKELVQLHDNEISGTKYTVMVVGQLNWPGYDIELDNKPVGTVTVAQPEQIQCKM